MSQFSIDDETISNEPVSLRDFFAGHALNGLLASNNHVSYQDAAEKAYEFADAMLELREKETQ